MGGHKISNQNKLHFLTFTVVGWVDIFTRKIYKDIIVDNLKYCIKEKGLILFSYVVMSNHIHLIVRTENKAGLSAIIRDFKSYTSKKIIKEIKENAQESRKEWMIRLFRYYAKYNINNSEYQLWKQNNRPVELISPKWIHQKLDYIHLNPVKAGLVEKPEHYLYSSATDYAGKEGLIKVEVIGLRNDIGYIFSD
ncbi:MAG: transposase [Bacteroidetes bacterium]|nr:transposase [Bacteroidota bacterium]